MSTGHGGKTGWADPAVDKNRSGHINYWIEHPLSIRTKEKDVEDLDLQLKSKLEIPAFSRLATSMTMGGGAANAALVILTFCPCKLVTKYQGDLNASYCSSHGRQMISSAKTVEKAVRDFDFRAFASIKIFNAYTLPFRVEYDNINRSSGLVYEHFSFYLRQLMWIVRPQLVLCVGRESAKVFYNLPTFTANTFSLCSAPEMGEMGEIVLPSAKLAHRREEVVGSSAKAMHSLRIKYIATPHPTQIRLEKNLSKKTELRRMWRFVMPQVVRVCYVSREPVNAFAMLMTGKKVAASAPATPARADHKEFWLCPGRMLVVPKATMDAALALHRRHSIGAWVTTGERPHSRAWFRAPLTRCKQIHFVPPDDADDLSYNGLPYCQEELVVLWDVRIAPALRLTNTRCVVIEDDDGASMRVPIIAAALMVLFCHRPVPWLVETLEPIELLGPGCSVLTILAYVHSFFPLARFTPACIEMLEDLARTVQEPADEPGCAPADKTPHGIYGKYGVRLAEPGTPPTDCIEFKGARHIDILNRVAAESRFCRALGERDGLERYLAMITNYSPADW